MSSKIVRRLNSRGFLNQFSLTKLPSRSLKDHAGRKVVVITGASRGIGYATTKKMAETLSHPTIYSTTRSNAEQLTSLIREEVDIKKAQGVYFKNVDVSNIVSVVELRNHIYAQQGQVDVLINNAGQYYHPAQSASEHFVQVQRSLDINYWGLKNVINAFLPMMSDTGRIVNMSSNLGQLCNVPGTKVRKQFADPNLTEKDLDEMIMEYHRHCTESRDDFEDLGWPRCSYTVSKLAVNAYTRILQKEMEDKGCSDFVVNSIHPGSFHTKITQEGEFSLTASEAANSVVSTALLPSPCHHPRGQFLWHNLSVVDWSEDSVGLDHSA